MRNRERGGIVLWIVLIIVGLGLLKYFLNWDVFDAAATDKGHTTIGYVRQIINSIWSVVGYPLMKVWYYALHPLLDMIWNNFMAFIHWGQDNAIESAKNGMYSGPLQ